jgi:hypothetical protein
MVTATCPFGRPLHLAVFGVLACIVAFAVLITRRVSSCEDAILDLRAQMIEMDASHQHQHQQSCAAQTEVHTTSLDALLPTILGVPPPPGMRLATHVHVQVHDDEVDEDEDCDVDGCSDEDDASDDEEDDGELVDSSDVMVGECGSTAYSAEAAEQDAVSLRHMLSQNGVDAEHDEAEDVAGDGVDVGGVIVSAEEAVDADEVEVVSVEEGGGVPDIPSPVVITATVARDVGALRALKVDDLRRLLRARGLDSRGTKDVLVERLEKES